MSKDIDTSQGLEGLSIEDLQYLAARDNQEAAALLAEQDASLDLASPRPIGEVAHTGDANTSGESIEDLERRLAAMKADQGASDEDDEDDEALEPPYDQYKNDDLRSEIVRRNEGREDEDKLSLDGKKEDLIQTLVDDDEDDEE